MNIQPIVQSGITTQNNQYNQAEQAPPAQIPQSELPNGCEAGFVVHIPDDIQQHAPECGERTALLSLINILHLILKKVLQGKKRWICLVYSMSLRWH